MCKQVGVSETPCVCIPVSVCIPVWKGNQHALKAQPLGAGGRGWGLNECVGERSGSQQLLFTTCRI